MHSSVTQPQRPRLTHITMLAANVLTGPLRIIVSRVTFNDFRLAAVERQHLFVVVVACIVGMPRPVPDDLIIPVAAETGIGTGVPLTDLRGVITMLAKDARPEGRLLRVIRAAGILADHPHRLDTVRMAAGQQCRSRGHAPRTEIRTAKPNAGLRQRVDMRRASPRIRLGITPHRLVRLIVGVDQQNVWPLRSAR